MTYCWPAFPCQSFSIAGVSKKTSLAARPRFSGRNAGHTVLTWRASSTKTATRLFAGKRQNLLSHDKGRTFDVIRPHPAKTNSLPHPLPRGEHAHFTPQNRERILIVGFREAGGIRLGCHPAATQRATSPQPHPAPDGWQRTAAIGMANVFSTTPCRSVPDKYTLTPKLGNTCRTTPPNTAVRATASVSGWSARTASPAPRHGT